MKTKLLGLAVAGALALPLAANAAPPVAFGGYTLDAAGNITLNGPAAGGCQTGFTCSANPITDTGFLQVQVTDDATGTAYFQTIVATDTGAEQFATEAFVKAGATNGGISAMQSMNSNIAGAGTLTSSTELNTGDFLPDPTAAPSVILSQAVGDGLATPEFTAGFTYNKIEDAAGNTIATLQLTQADTPASGEFVDNFTFDQITSTDLAGVTTTTSKHILITSGVTINPGGTTNDQSFKYEQLTGGFAASSATLSTGTVDWVAGDTIERVLVGQTVATVGDFGYERIGDLTVVGAGDNSETFSEFSLAATGPFATFATPNPFTLP